MLSHDTVRPALLLSFAAECGGLSALRQQPNSRIAGAATLPCRASVSFRSRYCPHLTLYSSDDAFDPSPIAAKRRRISTTSAEEEKQPPKRGRPRKPHDPHAEPKPKKPKHRVVVHEQRQPLLDEDNVFTQARQDVPSSQPWRLRGPKWTKPAPDPVVPAAPKTDHVPTNIVSRQLPSPGDTASKGSEGSDSDHESMALPSPVKQNVATTSTRIDVAAGLADIPSDAFDEFDIDKELADLPSDAFASSSSSSQSAPQQILRQEPILISSQVSGHKRPNLAAPKNATLQMNLFGQPAKNQSNMNTSQTNKRYNWTVPDKQELPTHHRLDSSALGTWIYPTNIGDIRDYQYNIVQRGLFNNLLAALPTGLGKTFIAATVMLNWYRWTQDAQIVFIAPTKPLVAQQVEACFSIAGIPRSDTTMLTGSIAPGLRAEEWTSKRVFFTTPQTVQHDFQSGIADPKRLVLLVVDEAHRATGNYAYVQLVRFIRRFNSSFRVLALTATPGNSVDAVQEVINGLDIARVEIRTESSLDIRQYVHQRKTDRKVFANSPEMDMIMEWFAKSLQPVVNIILGQNAYWDREPLRITPYGLTQARVKWNASETGRRAHVGTKAQVNRIFTLLASLAHALELLKFHGLGPFYHTIKAFQNTNAISKGGHKYETMIIDNENFQKMMTRLQFWVNNQDFIGHPKLEYLQELVLSHFAQTAELQEVDVEGQPPRETRIMIFAHFRDSAEEICRVLKRHQPMIRPHVFVGQSSSKGSEGMDQKKQQEIIGKFKAGEYNTLVATSIGEEGLDIGEVDLIVCYDSSASPIRMLQRMGRTGRKRAGAIVLLLMRGKEEDSFVRAKDSYEKMQAMISNGDRFDFHEDKSPRILPKEVDPEPEHRHIEIPPENTQGSLPEPTKKRRRAPKKPPKKFHMPDNVKTGFVRASHLDASDESDDDGTATRTTKTIRRPKIPKKDLAPIPTQQSVTLSPRAQQDFERAYLQVHHDADVVVAAPATDRHPELQRQLQPTRLVRHGRATKRAVNVIKNMRAIDSSTISCWERLSTSVDVDAICGPLRTLRQTPASSPAPAARSRKKSMAATTPKSATTKPKPTTPKPKSRANDSAKPRGRPKKQTYVASDSDMEGGASSPPLTDPRLALPTQGIDLGSEDTEGQDEADGYIDSSLRAFVVGSDEVEYARVEDDDLGSDREGVGGGAESRGDEESEGSSLPDVDTLVANRSVLPEPGRGGNKGGGVSPASKRLSQVMGGRRVNGNARRRGRIVSSEDDSDD